MTAGGEIIDQKNLQLVAQLRKLNLPIVTDSPSCADGFIRSFKGNPVLDSTQFIATHLITRLEIKKVDTVVVHPTCSSAKIDENSALIALAGAIANEVIVPPNWGCCGFAGDRGLLIPELTASATREEAAYVKSVDADFHISNNRTCEMAMTSAVGSEYVSVIKALHELLSR
jgi:D-lactate dehydrogenase